MLMKSKVETDWLEQEIISALFVQMSWGELFPPTKTDRSHPPGNDFMQNYFTTFLRISY